MTTRRRPVPRALVAVLTSVLLLAIPGCAGTHMESHDVSAAPAAPSGPQDQSPQRDIVTTGAISVTVADIGGAADRLADSTTALGGHVDDRTEHASSGRSRLVELTLRVPSAKVDEFLESTKQLGDVTSLSMKHEDVTAGRVDLDARIAALQTSVDRLTALMKTAATTADLLAAEDALSKRQADLDSLRAQRDQLGDRIEYATITVALSSESPPPAPGFVASVRRGWNALVAFTHGVIALTGFLLPWTPVLAAAAGAVVVLRRRSRRRFPTRDHRNRNITTSTSSPGDKPG